MSTAKPYDIFAQFYDRAYAAERGDMYNILRPILDRALVNCNHILDLGCGTGLLSLQIARAGRRVAGIDNHPEMLKIARRRARGSRGAFRVAEGDMSKLTFEASFDAAVCFFDTLNHLQRKSLLKSTFAGVARSLVPGGSFIFDLNTPAGVAYPWPDPPSVDSGVFQGKKYTKIGRPLPYNTKKMRGGVRFEWFLQKPSGDFSNIHENYFEVAWTDSEVASALRSAGFAIVKTWDGCEIERGLARGLRCYYWARKKS